MEVALLLLIALLVLAGAALRWSFDSSESVDSPERERSGGGKVFINSLSRQETL